MRSSTVSFVLRARRRVYPLWSILNRFLDARAGRIESASQRGVAIIEYIMLLSLFVILLAAAFVKFQGLLYKWFGDYVQTVIGPSV